MMNWFRTILDGLTMSAVFNCCVAVFWILKLHSFIVMFPKNLQKGEWKIIKDINAYFRREISDKKTHGSSNAILRKETQ